MATELPIRMAGRPRPWLLIALGAAVAMFIATKYWPAATAPPAPVRVQPAPSKSAAANGTADPESLKVRLEELKAPRPQPGEEQRNPFRFYVKPQPPPPPVNPNPPPVMKPPEPTGPPPPPPIPPIPLKFIAIVEGRGVGKVAAFSDCKRTFYGREGDIVDGRYKLVKIGLESVTMTHLDGQGQQVIRLSGQECIGK